MIFNKYEDNFNIISKNLKCIREEKGMSQDSLSGKLALLGITLYQSDIFKIEHNQRHVRDFELWGITQVLNITSEDLYSTNTDN